MVLRDSASCGSLHILPGMYEHCCMHAYLYCGDHPLHCGSGASTAAIFSAARSLVHSTPAFPIFIRG